MKKELKSKALKDESLDDVSGGVAASFGGSTRTIIPGAAERVAGNGALGKLNAFGRITDLTDINSLNDRITGNSGIMESSNLTRNANKNSVPGSNRLSHTVNENKMIGGKGRKG